MAHSHRGIRQYQGDESGNIGLGQLGFKALTTGTLSTGDGNFFMIKVVGDVATANVDIDATCHQGDLLDIHACVTGEVIYGAFKNITISNLSVSTMQVLCYYGNPMD